MDIVSTVAHLSAMAPWGIRVRDHQQIVFAVVLDDARPFEQALLVFFALEDLLMAALDHIREVGFQLHHLSRAIDHIDTIVVIEEE